MSLLPNTLASECLKKIKGNSHKQYLLNEKKKFWMCSVIFLSNPEIIPNIIGNKILMSSVDCKELII